MNFAATLASIGPRAAGSWGGAVALK